MDDQPEVPASPYRDAPPKPEPEKPFPTSTIVALAVGLAAIFVLSMALPVAGIATKAWSDPGDLIKGGIALTAGLVALAAALVAALGVRVPRVVYNVGFGVIALFAIGANFEWLHFKYPKFYHRHEQYHTYVGARFFPELGYDLLYRCTVVAQDDLGLVGYTRDDGSEGEIDLRAEVRQRGRKLRDVGGDNDVIDASEVLAHPEVCRSRFSDARWELFKKDVAFFRTQSDKDYWERMELDSGYGMSPVWTIAGRVFASLHPASIGYQQLLGGLDVVFLAGMFAAIAWAFGFRVAAVAAIFWACQGTAPFNWTLGAFLRQDWLFYLVLSVCLARKRRFALSGAAMMYATLLRGFPGYVALGWVVMAAVHVFKHRRLAPHHLRVLAGAAVAAGVLVGASVAVAGADAYPRYYRHLAVVEAAPRTNSMGLRAVLAHEFGGQAGSGRMEFARDDSLPDAFAKWKRMYDERADRLAVVGWGVIALAVAGFAAVIRRWRLLWVGACLGQVFVVLLVQMLNLNYAFLVLSAVLTRVRRGLEVALFSFAALTQTINLSCTYFDDRSAILSAVSLLFCLGLVVAFRRRVRAPRRARRRKKRRKANAAAQLAT